MDEAARQNWPATAEALMRSRFEAFTHGDVEWLLVSWHSTTRPEPIELDDETRWRGLQIVEVVDGDEHDDRGVVEFRASYVGPSGHGVLHERSRFVREQGHWVYLDGDILE